ncbi:MAG: DUF302 domain-containing protein [Bacteroidia bacterium]|nr:DUF302 domain-containing protein [Bacteroidia bacterium]
MNSNQFIIEQASPFDVSTTVEKIIETAVSRGWQNPATHNLQQSLAKSSKEVRPVQVIEICKPAFSGQILERNHERIFSIMMPCRISVYEKEDGKAYVALLDTSAMSAGMPETVIAAMSGASDESFEIVKAVIHP